MNKINAVIIADSIANNSRITTFLVDVPQIIVKELLRHRMFSFSSSSMRAIPFKRVLQDIKENMFVPMAFQCHHSGMQGTEYLSGQELENAKLQWIQSGLKACDEAERLYNLGVTKQLCSRIIESFGYAKILITATEFENFFELRCPKYYFEPSDKYFRSRREFVEEWNATFWVGSDISEKATVDSWTFEQWQERFNHSQAEIHIQALAEVMWDTMNESTPKELKAGEWHIPFGDKMDENKLEGLEFFLSDVPNGLHKIVAGNYVIYTGRKGYAKLQSALEKMLGKDPFEKIKVKVATARCARLSYMTHDGEINYEKDIKLHDQLLRDRHLSPFEHCAKVMNNDEYFEFAKGRMLVRDGYGNGDSLEQDIDNNTHGWCNNFRGWIQYRHLIENNL